MFTADQIEEMHFFKEGGMRLIRAMTNQNMPLDLKGREDDWVSDLAHTYELETRNRASATAFLLMPPDNSLE